MTDRLGQSGWTALRPAEAGFRGDQPMAYAAKNYDHLIGTLPGFSEAQLRAHFELYQGYVRKLNEIEDKLKSADPKTADSSYGEISELLRRRSFAHNGAILHELFFDNLTGKETDPTEELKMAIEQDFGSLKGWFDQLKAGLISEPGWVLLTRSRLDGRLRNDLLAEHHIGILVEQEIILVFDGWEHACMIDYGTRKADYVAQLERSINWHIAVQRFESSEMRSRAAA